MPMIFTFMIILFFVPITVSLSLYFSWSTQVSEQLQHFMTEVSNYSFDF